MKSFSFYALLSLISLFFVSCATITTEVNNTPGRNSIYVSQNSPGKIQGIGIESQDIVSMTDKMMRDMLSNSVFSNMQVAPYVVVDEQYFKNESSNIINKRLIIERLMVNLNRAAKGRMFFIERNAIDMVEKERKLKRQGKVTSGTIKRTEAAAGADYRLTGRIMSQDMVNPNNAMKSRYHQIVFKMVNLENGVVVWSGIYEFQKESQNDIIYR